MEKLRGVAGLPMLEGWPGLGKPKGSRTRWGAEAVALRTGPARGLGDRAGPVDHRNGGSSKLRSLRECSELSWLRSRSSAAIPMFKCWLTARL